MQVFVWRCRYNSKRFRHVLATEKEHWEPAVMAGGKK